jgi:GNAT superfamily N-acetyltransferase
MSDPRKAEPTIAPMASASAHDIAEVVAVIARAFYPDPLFGFFARDRLHEYHLLAGVFDAFVADARSFNSIYGARVENRLVGAAVWLPPDGMPRTRRREVTFQLRSARVLAGARHRRAGFALLDAIDKLHPHEPHWYLMLLGTDPLVQGRGVGTRLLAPTLERCDGEGMPAYLETQKQDNLPFYARHGFAVDNEVRLPNAPPVWTMLRPPQSAARNAA